MSSNSSVFNFDSTYLELPSKFYSKVHLKKAPHPEFVYLNPEVKRELGIESVADADLLEILSSQRLDENSIPIAQAYAGHQFGHFTMLGDGRAVILGEHINPNGERFDIGLKGSGPTPYSRRGDGKSTLKSALKEYVMSEALHYLGIPTSRSLAVLKTGESVYRENRQQGAVLARVMTSYLRVGTFEFARYYGDQNDLRTLFDYTIHRHFPTLGQADNPATALLKKLMDSQIDLILNWLRVGFIHGVMNTDNVSIFGETFDYGPCAFMGVYHPDTVFSSIDEQGRYSFDNQSKILKWNLARFAETILPFFDSDEKKSIEIATEILNEFDSIFNQRWFEMMCMKLGIENPEEGDSDLVNEFLELLKTHKKDYNHSFTFLRLPDLFEESNFTLEIEFKEWMAKWRNRIQKDEGRALSIMEKYNPVLIPRNFFVEEALNQAVEGDFSKMDLLLDNLKYPYTYKQEMNESLFTPDSFDENNFLTFCGT